MRPGVVTRPIAWGPPPVLWTGRTVPHILLLDGDWVVIASGDAVLDEAAVQWVVRA